jgi:hypothetical protein
VCAAAVEDEDEDDALVRRVSPHAPNYVITGSWNRNAYDDVKRLASFARRYLNLIVLLVYEPFCATTLFTTQYLHIIPH